ncbi:exodeoxyribonuclease V subunit alpha [Pantoea sp. Mhis]|uniref:exodeoxyribonuclease V subunit alpha n=1 Tax=Pantoea sp. Mhis TaxID=2576759 RepID=UPI00135BACB5|nr:exodeoxyribonuclease V subunit alpha [Pantoea sp. Mhis]MXP56727.1 exodeoxyribonuclease V subunit alpha [Pantoea sp. Mhis]
MIKTLLKQALKLHLLRTLDLQFAELLVNDNYHPARFLVTALLSAEVGKGNICLPLSQLTKNMLFKGEYPELSRAIWQAAGKPQNWHSIFKNWSALTSVNQKVAPIILDANSLYLHRLWEYKEQIINFLKSNSIFESFASEQIRAVLDKLFGIDSENCQKIAAAVVLTQKIAIISGGIGTGKTITLVKILMTLISLSKGNLRIQIIAPTVKEATLLKGSLRKILQALSLNSVEQKHFPLEVISLYRLLGVHSETLQPKYHSNNHLHLDVLVINSAFMIDLKMMVNVITALPPQARVVLIGDQYQLIPMKVSSLIGDICYCYAKSGYSHKYALKLSLLTGCKVPIVDSLNNIPIVIQNSICLLYKKHDFNQNTVIEQLARFVNNGKIKKVKSLLNNSFTNIKLRPIINKKDYLVMVEEIAENYKSFLKLIYKKAEIIEIIHAFNHYKVLCIMQEGILGANELNYSIEHKLIDLEFIQPYRFRNPWYQGRPIILTCNCSTLGLFKGDIGITLYNHEGILKVFFLHTNKMIQSISLNHVPMHKTAWAMTIYQSQGLVFNHTALVMPIRFISQLTRELLYTAIISTRNYLTVYSRNSIFYHTLQSPYQRYTGGLESFDKLINS